MRRAQVNALQWALTRALGYSLAFGLAAGAAAPPPPATDPLSIYPAFDFNLFPPHTAAGDWGVQVPLVQPNLPINLVDVTAASFAELNTHCLAATLGSGRRITITADIGGGVVNGNITNVEIILPAARTMNGVFFGSGGSGTVSTRMRIRGTTAGDRTTGGNVHNCYTAGTWTHLVWHGINFSGAAELSAYSTFGATNDPHTYVYVVGCGGQAGNDIFLGDPNNIMWVGNSFQAGAAGNGFEQWVIRTQSGGYQIFFANDFRGHQFDMVRDHPRTGLTDILLWIYGNILLEDTETKWVRNDASFASQTGVAAAVWVENNYLYAPGPSGTPINIVSASRAYVRNNFMFTSWGMDDSDINISGATSPVVSGNTYAAYTAPPAYGFNGIGSGNPTAILWDF
jgi:hypothetical protein